MTAAGHTPTATTGDTDRPTLVSGGDANLTLPDASLDDAEPREKADDPVPSRIGRYEVVRRLGSGNMGVVYLARDPELDRDVALKFLNPDGGVSDLRRAEARMRREARAMARLRHPGIVSIHECGTHDGRLFLAMEYVEGITLDRWLDNEAPAAGGLSPARVARLGIELFDALAHAHQQDVVHRDLKPENIFICRDDTDEDHLVVADFGVAKINAAGGSPLATRAGAAIGTPLYMSPEQAGGAPVDARSDLFSAGLILMRLLTGHVPLRARTALDQIRVRAAREIPPLPSVYPPQLRSLCDELCARDREDRPSTAKQVRARLEAALTAWASAPDRWDQPIAPPPDYPVDVSILGPSLRTGTETNGPTHRSRASTESETIAAAGEQTAPAVAASAATSAKPRRRLAPVLALTVGVAATTWLLLPTTPEVDPSAAAPKTPAATPPAAVVPAATTAPPKPGPPPSPTPARPDALEELARVNTADPEQALPYSERHALLLELEGNADAAPYIDHRINTGLDLLQAHQAPDPCEVFARALTTIESEPASEFASVLEQASIPVGPQGQACTGLAKRLRRAKRRLSRLSRRPRPTRPDNPATPEVDSTPAPSVAHPVPVTEKLDG